MIEVMYLCKSSVSDKWCDGYNKFTTPKKAIRFCMMVKNKWGGIITLITGDDREEVDYVSRRVNISKI
jgi:acid phosphatase class B